MGPLLGREASHFTGNDLGWRNRLDQPQKRPPWYSRPFAVRGGPQPPGDDMRKPKLKALYLMVNRDEEAAGRLMVACGGPSNTDEPVHPAHITLAALSGKKPIGLIVAKVNEEFCELLYVGVMPDRRREGVATFLLNKLLKIPKVSKAGWIRTVIMLTTENVPAMNWLKSCRFHGSCEGDAVRFGMSLNHEPLLVEV